MRASGAELAFLCSGLPHFEILAAGLRQALRLQHTKTPRAVNGPHGASLEGHSLKETSERNGTRWLLRSKESRSSKAEI